MAMISTGIAQASDLRAIYELGQTVAEFEVNDQTVGFWPQAVVADAITSTDVLVIVARNDREELIGFIIANLNKTLRKVLIENLVVAPHARGRKVGGVMLAHLVAIVSGSGYEYLAALVPLQAESALRAYGEAGFSRGHSFVWLDRTLSRHFRRSG